VPNIDPMGGLSSREIVVPHCYPSHAFEACRVLSGGDHVQLVVRAPASP
jgi:hypothetical protein